MEFSRQEYQSGLPFPSPGDFPNPGIEPISPSLQVVSCIAGGFSTIDASGNGGSLKTYKQRYLMIQQYYCLGIYSEKMETLNQRCESESHSILCDSAIPWVVQSMEFSRPEYQSEQPFSSPGDLPNPGIKPRSPALQADSLPGEPLGKPKNTGVGSLSLLQQIFLTQESNWGLLHCRWILYELSYQGIM